MEPSISTQKKRHQFFIVVIVCCYFFQNDKLSCFLPATFAYDTDLHPLSFPNESLRKGQALEKLTEQSNVRSSAAPARLSRKEKRRKLSRLLKKLPDEHSLVRVMVGYRNDLGRKSIQDASMVATIETNHLNSASSAFVSEIGDRHNKKYSSLSSHLNVIPAYLNATALFGLNLDPNIIYLEEDEKVSLSSIFPSPDLHAARSTFASQPKTIVHTYGRTLIQADLADLELPLGPTVQSCSDPNAFKVAIVDSGVFADHPDLPCRRNSAGYDDSQVNCIGAEFGLPSDSTWDNPIDDHGTLIMGIIGASPAGMNSSEQNVGMLGVASSTDICWVVARVFLSVTTDAFMSDIYDGVAWAVDQGVKVINMSLGGSGSSYTGQTLYSKLWDQDGIITVAASGNAGTNDYSYPASYDGVVSVSAIQENMTLAKFSQTNDAVDLTAPGNEILSTALLQRGNYVWLITVTESEAPFSSSSLTHDFAITARLFETSLTPPSNGLIGTLVYCPDSIKNICPGPGSHICLAPFVTADAFKIQQTNCDSSGGLALIIYNDQSSDFIGVLDYAGNIPVFSVSLTFGNILVNCSQIGVQVQFVQQDGYSYADGTSFAVPHVTGAFARVWQLCPTCNNKDVVSCMQLSARDLGPSGKDSFYGFGLIQIVAAHQCLVNEIGCCASAASPAVVTKNSSAKLPTAGAFCQQEEDDYLSCLGLSYDLFEAQACVDCMSPAVANETQNEECSAINLLICQASSTCSCGDCMASIMQYLSCATSELYTGSCRLNCSAISTPSPQLTTQTSSSPNSLSIKPEWPSVAPFLPTSTVLNIFTSTQIPISSMSIRPTISQPISTLVPTVFSTFIPTTMIPVLDPPTQVPEANICAANFSAYRFCSINNMTSSQAEYCRDCINNRISMSTNFVCETTYLQICPSLLECECDICRYEIQNYLSCVFTNDNNCTIDCNRYEIDHLPTTAPVQSIAVQTSVPSDVCIAEAQGYRSCFNNTMTQATTMTCQSCVNAQVHNDGSDCIASGTAVCSAISSCNCDGCSYEIYNFFNCIFLEFNQCSFTCDNLTENFISSPTILPNASSAAIISSMSLQPTSKLRDATTQPAQQSSCVSELQTFNKCTTNDLPVLQASECSNCVKMALFRDEQDCSTLVDSVCYALNSCNCGDCRIAFESLLLCYFQDNGCPIDCVTEAPGSSSEKNDSNNSLLDISSSVSDRMAKSTFLKYRGLSLTTAVIVALLCTALVV